MEERDETARLLRERDSAAIAEKAAIARQIAVARGDVEVEAKWGEFNDPAVFWAYVAATKPVYAYEACLEYVEAEAKGRPPQMRLGGEGENCFQ